MRYSGRLLTTVSNSFDSTKPCWTLFSSSIVMLGAALILFCRTASRNAFRKAANSRLTVAGRTGFSPRSVFSERVGAGSPARLTCACARGTCRAVARSWHGRPATFPGLEFVCGPVMQAYSGAQNPHMPFYPPEKQRVVWEHWISNPMRDPTFSIRGLGVNGASFRLGVNRPSGPRSVNTSPNTVSGEVGANRPLVQISN